LIGFSRTIEPTGSPIIADAGPAPELSIVVPAHNEGWRLPDTLAELFGFLASQSYKAEVIVVENGSTDDTAEVVRRLRASFTALRLLSLKAAGKGGAIRAGVLDSRGQAVFLCDADLSTPAAEIPRFLATLEEGYDIVAGSREGIGAFRYGEPAYRHIMGRVFNRIVQLLAVPHMNDTQCGFKAFSRTAARQLFPLQTITGWAFDVEILYLARKFGFRTVELPVEWRFNDDTKVRALHDTRVMLTDILRVRINDIRGRYRLSRPMEMAHD
jgi:dolichyl-phosphate beta-glucosyltransferase